MLKILNIYERKFFDFSSSPFRYEIMKKSHFQPVLCVTFQFVATKWISFQSIFDLFGESIKNRFINVTDVKVYLGGSFVNDVFWNKEVKILQK